MGSRAFKWDRGMTTILRRIAAALGGAALLVSVAGCGGGADESRGGLTAFNVTPTSMTITGPDATTCGSGYAGRVYVYGGAGPYTVNNTLPGVIVVSKTTVSGPGDYFDVSVLGGCLTTIPIVVVDQLGRQATVTITTTKGST